MYKIISFFGKKKFPATFYHCPDKNILVAKWLTVTLPVVYYGMATKCCPLLGGHTNAEAIWKERTNFNLSAFQKVASLFHIRKTTGIAILCGDRNALSQISTLNIY